LSLRLLQPVSPLPDLGGCYIGPLQSVSPLPDLGGCLLGFLEDVPHLLHGVEGPLALPTKYIHAPYQARLHFPFRVWDRKREIEREKCRICTDEKRRSLFQKMKEKPRKVEKNYE
jgi:hypothetical protein